MCGDPEHFKNEDSLSLNKKNRKLGEDLREENEKT